MAFRSGQALLAECASEEPEQSGKPGKLGTSKKSKKPQVQASRAPVVDVRDEQIRALKEKLSVTQGSLAESERTARETADENSQLKAELAEKTEFLRRVQEQLRQSDAREKLLEGKLTQSKQSEKTGISFLQKAEKEKADLARRLAQTQDEIKKLEGEILARDQRISRIEAAAEREKSAVLESHAESVRALEWQVQRLSDELKAQLESFKDKLEQERSLSGELFVRGLKHGKEKAEASFKEALHGYQEEISYLKSEVADYYEAWHGAMQAQEALKNHYSELESALRRESDSAFQAGYEKGRAEKIKKIKKVRQYRDVLERRWSLFFCF